MNASTALMRVQGVVRADDAAGPNALPPSIKDAQGRVYTLQVDPVTQHPQYRHASVQRDAAGNQLDTEILIDLAPDGSFTRRTTQSLALATGDTEREVVLASFGPDGKQVGETVEATTKQGTLLTQERTVGTFAAGVLVKRETDLVQRQEATDPETGEQTSIEARFRGVWEDGGKPITNAVVPSVERTDTERIVSPGQGIHKDTDRSITFTKRGAGTPGAIVWETPAKLVVRFDARKGRYLEREMAVPVDGKGAPNLDAAEVVRTTDTQTLVTKGMTQARVWGGLVSNLAWVGGVLLGRGSLTKGFLGLSAAAAGAEFVGESHAHLTRRNDADWGRLIMSAYDVVLTGALAAYMSAGRDVNTMRSSRKALVGAAVAASTGVNAREALGQATSIGQPLGAERIGRSALLAAIDDATDGVGELDLRPLRARDPRMESRFDAARALVG